MRTLARRVVPTATFRLHSPQHFGMQCELVRRAVLTAFIQWRGVLIIVSLRSFIRMGLSRARAVRVSMNLVRFCSSIEVLTYRDLLRITSLRELFREVEMPSPFRCNRTDERLFFDFLSLLLEAFTAKCP